MMAMLRLMEIGGTAPNRSTIHSGHYMISCLDETSDDTDYYGCSSTTAEPEQHQRRLQRGSKQERVEKSSCGFEVARTSEFIESNLAELLRYMTLTYNGTLPSPKWKDFKGIKLKLRQKIRLNNIIWREWHMQYIKFKNPVMCRFDVPTSDRTHNRPEAVVLEGKYCKRRLESLAVEYNRWRRYAKQQHQLIKNEENAQILDKLLIDSDQLGSFVSLMKSFADETMQVDSREPDAKRLNFMDDPLFTSLAQPFVFPCAREIAAEARNYFSSDMIVQPGLVQLQPNLSESPASYDAKPARTDESPKVSRRNPILSSLLTGTYSSGSGLTDSNKLQMARGSACPPSTSHYQTQATFATKSSNFCLPSFETNASFMHFSAQSFSTADGIAYSSNNLRNSNSMTFMHQQQDLHLDSSSFSSSILPLLSFPMSSSTSSPSSNQSHHLRALLQGNGDIKLHKEEITTKAGDESQASFLHPTKRRRSTGQTIQGMSSLQACNKNLQKLVDSERAEKSYRRASTGTMLNPSSDATFSSSSSIFTVPRVQKLKSHSVGSRPLSPVASARRRKLSCVSRAAYPMGCHHEDTDDTVVGDCGRSVIGSLAFGPCYQDSGGAGDIGSSPLWDIPVISQPVEESDCPFEAESFTCQILDSGPISMINTQHMNSSVGCVRQTSNSMSASSATVQSRECIEDELQSISEEMSGCLIRLEREQERHHTQRRALHLSSEQKRRVTINSGFERLEELIRSSGEKPNSKSSKSATLNKSAQFIRNLQKDKLQLHNETELLKKEIEILQNDLNLLQSNLPIAGCLPSIRPKAEAMCELYSGHVCSGTQSNWKFWIFGQLMRPVFRTYVQSMSSVVVSNFGQAVKYWLEQHCSLTVLRPAVSNELREICKRTSLINDPLKLPQEALQASSCHVAFKPD